MADWLTTHYPHPFSDDLPWDIYLKREHRDLADQVSVGDRVFFYEYKEQKPLRDGSLYPQGAEGIVRVATVNGEVYHRNGLTKYADGTDTDWCWGVPTRDVDAEGFVPREAMNRVLDYQEGYVLRGFGGGRRGSGLRKISADQANALYDIFKSDHRCGR